MDDPTMHTGPLARAESGAIVRGLLEGEQVLVLCGDREPDRPFGRAADRFVLYPVVAPRDAALLKPAYRAWAGSDEARRTETVVIDGWAEVTARSTITDADELVALDSKLIWTPDYAPSRLHWRPGEPLEILVLRVYRLLAPVTTRDRSEPYDATGWITLPALPDSVYELPSEPTLSDTAFAGRLANLPTVLRP